MKLLELFNRTAEWKWLSNADNPFPGMFEYAASFVVNDITYVVGIGPLPIIPGFDAYMMGFAARIDGNWEEDELGTSNGLLVFSTIMEIIGEFLQKHNPDIFLFGAKPHRENIYNRLLKKRAKDLENIDYVPYGRIESNFPMYGSVVLLPLVRSDKLDAVKELDLS